MRKLSAVAACALLLAAPLSWAAPPETPDQQHPDQQRQKADKHRDKKAEKHESRRADTAPAPKVQPAPTQQAQKPAPSPAPQAQQQPPKPEAKAPHQPTPTAQAAKPAESPKPNTEAPKPSAEAPKPSAVKPPKHETATAPTPPHAPGAPQSAQAEPPSAPKAPDQSAKPQDHRNAPGTAVPGAINPPATAQHLPTVTANPPATGQAPPTSTATAPSQPTKPTPSAGTATANPPAGQQPPSGNTAAAPSAPPAATTAPTTSPAPATTATTSPPSGQQQRQADRRRESLSGAETMGIVGLAMAPWIAQALRGQPQQQPAQVYVVPGRGPVPPPDAYYSYASPYPDSARATGTYTYYGPDSYQPVRNPFSTRYEELAVTPGTSSSGPAPRTTHAGSQTGQAAVPLAPPKEWRYDEVYQQGWSAVHLLHSAVTGPNNRPIGTVENVLLTPDGQAAGLLIDAQPQSGNPTTLSVPWSQVQVLKGGRVTANIDLSRPEQYAMFGVNSVLAVPVSGSMKVDQNDRQPHPWSVTQLIGDNVMTSDAAGFGVVHDVVFGTDNRIQAIVVHRDLTQGGGGAFAFPFFGQAYGFDPMLPFYPVPYNSQQVAEMPRFDEGKVD